VSRSPAISVFALVFFLVAHAAITENNQKTYPESSDIYQALTSLYLEAGLSEPSTSRPFSAAEVLHSLEKIDPRTLSAAGKHSYNFILRTLNAPKLYSESEKLSFDGSLQVNAEGYVHWNRGYTDWEYGYEQRKAMVDFPLEIWVLDSFYALMEPSIKQDPFVPADPDTYTNVITDLSAIDPYFPFRALLSVGGDHWNVQFGRDLLSWGNGRTGNLMLADNAGFYDYLLFSTYWKYFKFITTYISLESWDEADLSEPADVFKSFLGHRIEIRFWDRVNFAVTESMMLEGKYVETRYLNPFMIYHGWMNNDLYGNININLELELNPYKWVSIYGQWCGDQIQAGYEKKKFPSVSDLPTAYGYILGTDFRYPLGKGYLSANFEWVLTDPWLYLIEGQPDYIIRRRVRSNFLPGTALVKKPMGYETGPDSMVYSFAAGYQVYGGYRLQTGLTYIQQGENTIETPFETGPAAIALSTPTGIPEHKLVWHLQGELELWKYFTLGTHLYFVQIWNYNHDTAAQTSDLQWVPYLSMNLRL
jgi:hypothetical protein